MHRRKFLQLSLASLAAAPAIASQFAAAGAGHAVAPGVVDTNIHLFSWPFRRLKYGSTAALVEKLKRHNIEQAWAGTFEALLHKNLGQANARLAAECRSTDGFLLPVGSVQPTWPDWQEELRRCHENHGMRAIRLHPSYQGYTLDHPAVAELLAAAAQRGLLVQIALGMEDERVHHPVINIAKLDTAPLVDALQTAPQARVQLLNWSGVRGPALGKLISQTHVAFDFSHLEGNGGLHRLIEGTHPYVRARVPLDRLLLGSHAPYFPCESALLKLFESPLRRDQFEPLMRDNARRLLESQSASEPASPGDTATEDDSPPADPLAFALDPRAYGLPNRDDLVALRIWDGHYHGFINGSTAEHEQTMAYVRRLGIERVLALDIAGYRNDPFAPSEYDEEHRAILAEQQDILSGLIRIDPSDPSASCDKMRRWIADGPCVGIKYAGFNRDGLPCSHPNNFPIIRLAEELHAIVYFHAWMKVGGQPRRPGGGNNAGESSPLDVALLAERFPSMPLICGHSGGDWELGVRAIRPHKNVYFEFAGSDPHSGQVDFAVRELGIDRIVWGGHGPTRSYATELSKVLDADLTQAERMQILGGNLRGIAEQIFRKKGQEI